MNSVTVPVMLRSLEASMSFGLLAGPTDSLKFPLDLPTTTSNLSQQQTQQQTPFCLESMDAGVGDCFS